MTRWSRVNPWRAVGELPRSVAPLLAATFVNRAGAMVLPFLALYLTQGRGLAPSTAGIALGSFGAAGLVAGPLAGRLAERVGARRVLLASLVATGVALLVYPFVSGGLASIAITAVWALAAEAFTPAMFLLLADVVEPARHRQVYSAHRLAVNLGMAMGSAAAGFVALRSYRTLFVVDALSAFAAAAVLSFAWSAPAVRAAGDRASAARGRVLDGAFVAFLAGVVSAGLVFHQSMSSMPVDLATRLAMSTSSVGLLFGLNGVLIVLFEVALTSRLSSWSFRRTLVSGSAVLAIGFGALAFVRTTAGAVAAVVLWTAGEMVLFPAATAYVASIAHARRGLAMGLYNAAWSVSFASGPAVGMLSLARFGAHAHWALVCAVGLTGAGMFALACGTGGRVGRSP